MIKTPVIIDENGDISFYATCSGAESRLEVIDVMNNIYVGYDAAGHLLAITPLNRNSVRIMLAEHEPNHANELVDKLKKFLKQVGQSVNEGADLDELINCCSVFIEE